MARKAPTYSYVVLGLLLVVYIMNQWDRYLFNYLSSVATPQCGAAKASDPCYAPKGVKAVGYCEPCPGNATADFWPKCQECHACLEKHNAPHRNLKDGACLTSTEYGLLAGFGFSALYVVLGLFAGRLADTFNRRNVIGSAFALWSLAAASQGLTNNFGEMLGSRIMIGVGEAFSAPPSYSLIADYFPKSERATANGIYSFGVYVGGGLGSISLLIASETGWRSTCFGVGATGLLLAIVFFAVVREPERGAGDRLERANSSSSGMVPEGLEGSVREENKPLAEGEDGEAGKDSEGRDPAEAEEGAVNLSAWESVKVIMRSPVVVCVFAASAMRFLGGYSIASYLPIYYARAFPHYNDQYSVINAFVVSLGGAISSYMGGFLADRLSKRTPRARALIPAVGAALGIVPFIGTMFLPNFYGSIACLFLEYLIAESWFGPAISLMQNELPAGVRGIAIAMYLFTATMVGNVAPLVIGALDPNTPAVRVVVFAAVLISYGGAALLFLLAGSLMKTQDKGEGKPLLGKDQ